MALIDVFQAIPDTIFQIFDSLKLPGVVIMASDNDGWSDAVPSPTRYPVDVIRTSLSKLDLNKVSFHDLIQVSDVVGLVKVSDIPVPVDTADMMEITDRFGRTITYEIPAFDVDAADALYIFLLRTS